MTVQSIKAVWLTYTDSRLLHSRQNLAEGLQRLADLGFNTIYPTVWTRGYTLYPSEIASQLTGAAVLPASPFVERDVLSEIIELAAPLQLRVIPWFEYGLMVPPRSPIALKHPDLLTIDIQGNYQRINGANNALDPHVWLNPCHPEVCKFTIDLIADLVRRYQVTGIQLDDHFCFPQELGYDRYTQQLYQQDYGGKSAPLHHDRAVWIDWGTARLTELLTQIVRALKAIDRNCVISISPNPLNFSRTRYLADWQAWAKLGLVDELVLQIYRDRLAAFKGELAKPEVRAIRQRLPTAIGILTGLKNRPIDSDIISQQIAVTIGDRFAGFSCFFYETLFHERLSPTVIDRRPTQLAQMLNFN
jgi:uncharacterized lipoprotein YddW (UPF0748 family)